MKHYCLPVFLFALMTPLRADAEIQGVRQAFAKRFPSQTAKEIEKTPISGLYQVVTANKEIVYTDKQARYFLDGNLLDSETKTNLTETRMADLTRIDWGKLPLKQAIKDVHGNGSRKLVVFSDPDCPYCRRLERDVLKGMDDVTVYTFLYPLTEIHPKAYQKAKQVWCAKDRTKAWNDLMYRNMTPSGSGNCRHPLRAIQSLGKKLSIHGTPYIVFPNGQVMAGLVPKERLERILSSTVVGKK